MNHSASPLQDPAPRTLILHPDDDVAVARVPLSAGTTHCGPDGTFILTQSIPSGHKLALRNIERDQPVKKYGHTIGFATSAIVAGDHVHTHNLIVRDFPRRPLSADQGEAVSPGAFCDLPSTFQGYARSNGRTGTRNYVGIISTVNCSASVARFVQEHFPRLQLQQDFERVDGVIALTHKTGCGLDPGESLRLLQRVTNGMADHPNLGGCVFIGLGCEVNQTVSLRPAIPQNPQPDEKSGTLCLNIQACGGTQRTIDAAVAAVSRLLPRLNDQHRTPQPLSQLVLAEQCGGSDAYSGITANPALGQASDMLVQQGGSSVLAETPEIYGAEHLLLHRASSPEVARKLKERLRWWEEYVRRHNVSLDNNPSPGNKTGGLTTIYEKSLGAVAKAGHSPLMAVYEYAEAIHHRGLCFMDTPGYDPVSLTGLVSGGCNLAVFTTGRGSVYGCKPAPCIKVASNSALFNHMSEDMDLNAGTIMEGKETVEEVGRRLFDLMIKVASGHKTKSEVAGFGDEEFAPWPLGPTL